MQCVCLGDLGGFALIGAACGVSAIVGFVFALLHATRIEQVTAPPGPEEQV